MSVAVAVFSLSAVPAAKASVTYDFTLTQTSPAGTSYSGMGSFQTSSALTSGTYSLSQVMFTTDNGDSFTPTGCMLGYSGGVVNTLYGCNFSGSNAPANVTVYSFGWGISSYNFGISGSGTTVVGNVGDLTLAPEPSTLLLWGTGLLALGAIFRKKAGVGSAA